MKLNYFQLSITLIFLFFSPLFSLTAQVTDFNPGIIVTAASDTIGGLVQETNLTGASIVVFKKNKNAPEITYQPADLISYEIGKDVYVESHKIIVDEIELSAFFHCHIKGQVSLYTTLNYVDKELLYISKTSPNDTSGLLLLEVKSELITKEKNVFEGNQQYRRKTNSYRRTLRRIFLDCPAMFPKIESYSLTLEAMKKAVLDYYRCQGGEYNDFKTTYKKVKPSFGIYGGIVRTKESKSNDVSDGNHPSFGIYGDFFLPGKYSRISIQPHIVVNRFKLTDDEKTVAVTVPVLITRHFLAKKSRAYVGAGFAFGAIPSIVIGAGYQYRLSKKMLLHFMIQQKTTSNTSTHLKVGLSF